MLMLASAGESIFQLIIVLIIFVGVLFATYYITKWIAGYQKASAFNKNLEVIEAIKVTQNKYVQIVRAGENHYYVIAVGKDEISLLGQLTEDDLKEISEDDIVSSDIGSPLDFKSILEKVSKKK